jgi:hypothetical protein
MRATAERRVIYRILARPPAHGHSRRTEIFLQLFQNDRIFRAASSIGFSAARV